MRLIVCLITFTFFGFSVFAQEDHIDSLKNLLHDDLSTENKIKIYNALCEELWHHDPNEAIIFADSAYNLIPKVNNVRQKIQAFANKGIAAYTNGKYLEAEKHYLKSIRIAEENDIYYHNGYVFYITLLKRKGDFFKVIKVADSLLSSIEVNSTEYADYLLTLSDVLIEVGELARARLLLENFTIIDHPGRYANYYLLFGKLLSIEGLYSASIDQLRASLEEYRKNGDVFGVAKTNLELGEAFFAISEYDSSRFYSEKAKEIYHQVDYPYGIANTDYQLGSLYAELGDLDLATEYYYNAVHVFESQGNLNELSAVLYDLAWVSQTQGNREQAFEFLNRSIELSDRNGNVKNKATGYNYIGLILFNEEDYQGALENFKKSFELRKSIGYKKGMAAAQFNMGMVYEEMGLYQAALEMYTESYELDKVLGTNISMAISENALGRLNTKLERFNQAEDYLNRARERLKELAAKNNLIFNYLYSAQYYEAINNSDRALEFYKSYSALKDSLFTEDKNRKIAELTARYQLNAKEREIELLNENKAQEIALKEQTIYNQQLLLAAIGIGSLLLAVLLIFAIRMLKIRKKANRELSILNRELHEKQEEITTQAEELREAHDQIVSINEDLEQRIEIRTKELLTAHEELDTFFYKSSHDFRRPLTTFLGLASLAEATIKDDEALNLFRQVRKTAEHLDKMVKKLQAVSLVGSDTLNYEKVEVKELVEEIFENYKTIAEQKNIELRYDVKMESFCSSSILLKTCIENLVENAVVFSKYPTENPYVFVSAKKDDEFIRISVEDNGIGIEEKYQRNIFDMYYRANERSHGNGLGLYIVKKAVERLGGTLDFKSEHIKGSAFFIKIPVVVNEESNA